MLVWAIHAVFWNNMILGFASRWVSKIVPQWVQFPLYGCVVCMSPYYGSAAYWIIWGNSWQEWVVCVLSVMGLNAILVSFLPKD